MRTLFRVLFATFCLVLGGPAVTDAGQSSPKPPANEDCAACHGDPDAKRANGTRIGVDAPAFAASTHDKEPLKAFGATRTRTKDYGYIPRIVAALPRRRRPTMKAPMRMSTFSFFDMS